MENDMLGYLAPSSEIFLRYTEIGRRHNAAKTTATDESDARA
jgi:hypothetical protein